MSVEVHGEVFSYGLLDGRHEGCCLEGSQQAGHVLDAQNVSPGGLDLRCQRLIIFQIVDLRRQDIASVANAHFCNFVGIQNGFYRHDLQTQNNQKKTKYYRVGSTEPCFPRY